MEWNRNLTPHEVALEKRIAELENLLAEGVHTCSHLCKRPMCVLRRELKAEREANARLEKWQDIVRRYSRYAAMYADARMPADYWEGKQE